ncbi:MAG: hypothetical protein K8S55_07005 [Phycisphaerae bacterium]|nr:hypothetical protein [Phycisphaerae bacterium]
MTETASHQKAKKAAAGKNGRTEVPLSRGRRLDALRGNCATEIERSRHTSRLRKAAGRLRDSKVKHKVLQVPHKNLEKAVEAMQHIGISGTVKNMGGSKRISVGKKRKR